MAAVSSVEELLEKYAAGERDFRNSTLRGADLTKAKLSFINLRGSDLLEADLRGANLRRANMIGVNLAKADLRGAKMRRANFETSNMTGANLERADLTGGAKFMEVDFTDASLRGALYDSYTKFPYGFDPVAAGCI